VHTSFSIEANIGEFDEVWRTRATQANKNAKESYNPHPEKVAANLNKHVHRYVLFSFYQCKMKNQINLQFELI